MVKPLSYYFFDSNAHPSKNSTWINKKNNNSFHSLYSLITRNNMLGALAVAIEGVDKFDEIEFIEECNKYNFMIPIAGFNPSKKELKKRLSTISKLGYRGIKLHPRFSNFELSKTKDEIIRTLNICSELNLVVLFCTYFFDSKNNLIINDPLDYLEEIVTNSSSAKIILMHSGFLDYDLFLNTLVNKKNLLFDFSYTLMHPSLLNNKDDVIILFNKYYDRICLGSDWPEFDYKDIFDRINLLLDQLPREKMINILNGNIKRIFQI